MIADYDQAIALNPEDATAYNGLCWTSALAGQAEQHLPACDREAIGFVEC